jgi:RHS repeat-associated protein
VEEMSGRKVHYEYDESYRLTLEQIVEPDNTWRTFVYKYDAVGNRVSNTEITAAGEVIATYRYNEKDQLVSEQTETKPSQTQAMLPMSMPLARHSFSLFGCLCLATILVPLGLLIPRDAGIGKRARRRRVFNTTICLLMALLMVVSPQELCALQVQARINQAVAAAVLATPPTPTTIEYTYDDNGNLKTRTVDGTLRATYEYDFENRLIRATVDAQTTNYTYDVDGLRTGQSGSDGTATAYLVDKNRDYAQVLVESKASVPLGTTDVVRYVWGDDLIQMTRPDAPGSPTTLTRYYHYDGQMSVRQLTDPAGVPSDAYTYDAFGVELAAAALAPYTELTPNVYRYTGEQLDANTGFYYLRARYYNPAVGRFLTMDTYAGDPFAPASLHKYAYCGNDPIDRTDPSGLDFNFVSVVTAASLALTITSALSHTCKGLIHAAKGETGEAFAEALWLATDILALGLGGPMASEGLALARAGGQTIVALARVSPLLAYGILTWVLQLAMAGNEASGGGGGSDPTIKHHIFPKFRGESVKSEKYRQFFKDRNIEVDDFTVEIPRSLHLRIIHGAGKTWLQQWREFIDNNPAATAKAAWGFAKKLLKEYGLDKHPIIPYR